MLNMSVVHATPRNSRLLATIITATIVAFVIALFVALSTEIAVFVVTALAITAFGAGVLLYTARNREYPEDY